MCLCFNDLTNASWPHSVLGSQSEFVPGATLEVLKPVGALTGTDGEVSPLLTVILRVLEDVAFKQTQQHVNEEFGGNYENQRQKSEVKQDNL